MKRSSLHIVALAALVLVSLYARSEAAMDASHANACAGLVAAIPGLQTLAVKPWTSANINSCNLQGVTCAVAGDGRSVVVELRLVGSAISALTGIFPVSIASLPSLTHFEITSRLTGELPTSWSGLGLLNYLSIAGNARVTGNIPSSWSSMASLKYLQVNFDPAASDEIALPSFLGSVSQLVIQGARLARFPAFLTASHLVDHLTMRSVRLPAGFSIQSSFFQSAIQTFILSAVDSTGFGVGTTLPTSMTTMTTLRTFSVSGIGIGGGIPTSWPTSLNSLTLDNLPNLAGTIPQALIDSRISQLSLSNLPLITGGLPGPTTPSSSLFTTITVADVGLTGSIASTWPNLPALESMSVIGCTSLTGGLPEVDIPSSTLTDIIFMGNSLIGNTIPASWASLPNLHTLRLDNNGLTGPIPQAFAQELASTTLMLLSLAQNALSGTLPAITLPSNSQLDLSNCGLTGPLPSSLANRTGLILHLGGNDFDLCANAGTTEQGWITATFSASITCSLTATAGRSDCSCLGVYPQKCFTGTCPPLAPTATPFAPSMSNPTSPLSSSPVADSPTTIPTQPVPSSSTPLPAPIAPSMSNPNSPPSSSPTPDSPTTIPTQPSSTPLPPNETPYVPTSVEPSPLNTPDVPALTPSQPTSIPLPPANNPSMGPISIPSFLPSLEPTGAASSTSFGLGVFVAAALAIVCAL